MFKRKESNLEVVFQEVQLRVFEWITRRMKKVYLIGKSGGLPLESWICGKWIELVIFCVVVLVLFFY